MAGELELEKKVRVMFPPILQHDGSVDSGFTFDSDSSQPSLREKITSTISEDPMAESPSGSAVPLPKIKPEHHLSADWSQQQQQIVRRKSISASKIPPAPSSQSGSNNIVRLEDGPSDQQFEKMAEEAEIAVKFINKSQYELDLTSRTKKGIGEIFTRSLEQHLTVEKMWTELKNDATRQLRPIMLYCHRLNRLASPSTRQCLDIYKKPTPIDKYTGKPIPLSEVLDQVKKVRSYRGSMSMLNSAMGQVVRYSQMRAELMLRRKDLYSKMTSSVHQDWYFTASALPTVTVQPAITAGSRAESRKTASRIRKIRRETPTLLRKNLPLYLTSSGSLVSASIEELDGEILYCTPSAGRQRKDEQQELEQEEGGVASQEGGGVPSSSSVFLTDITCEDTATVSDMIHPPHTAPAAASSSRQSHWQPLTPTALLEHATVSQIPVRGKGHLAHGHYPMWRPDSCYTLRHSA